MRSLLRLVIGLSMSFPVAARASPATFSEDGNTVWVISKDGRNLLGFEAPDHPPSVVPLPRSFEARSVTDLLSDPHGLLLAGNDKLWRWDPLALENPPELVAPFPPAFRASGLARMGAGPLAGAILINGRHVLDETETLPKGMVREETLYALMPGEKGFRGIFTRHLHEVTASPALAGDRMIFGDDGDLWEGSLAAMGEAAGRCGVLAGHRIAPLAAISTDEGNSEGQGVRGVVITGDTVWALLAGHHAGCSLVSLPVGKPFNSSEPESHPGPVEARKLLSGNLAQVKVQQVREGPDQPSFDSLESIDALCGWCGKDGQWKLAYRTGLGVMWIITNDSKEATKLGRSPQR